ncbi:MAG: hypothetical protein LBI65_04405 [Candidatus Symbiothrix sp.]|jgi:uncharacterized protein involved in exopolysaccharide biosynthesis|nr:hypothetical protein [Candidatus Symbiothrix sp.]
MENKKNELEQIKELILLWLKHWYYFVISFAVCGIIGIIYLKTATPIMNIEARVSLRHDESLMGSSISKANSMLSAFGLGSGSENIEDETNKMNSQGYIKNVVKKLELNKVYVQSEYGGFIKTNLYDQSPVILQVDPLIADTLTKGIHFTLKIKENRTEVKIKAGKESLGKFEILSFPVTLETSWGNFTLEKTDCYDLYDKPLNLKIAYTGYDYMAQVYRKKIFIDFLKKTSDLIDLNLKHENVPFAKSVLNEVINTYNNQWDADKDLVSDKTLLFIDTRLLLTKELLSEADLQIKQFKDKYNLTEITADVTYYFTATGELQAQLLQLENQLNIADIIVNFVQDEKNKYALIPFNLTMSDANMVAVIEKYNEELTRRNELYKANTQSAMARSLDALIDTQRENLLASIGNIRKSLQISRDNVKKKDREFSLKLGNVPSIEHDYVNLRREQELQQTVYIFLLEMREQMAVKGINLLPKLKIIDAPYVLNKRVSPRKLNVAMITFILGMGMPLALIYGIPFLRSLRKKENE